MGNYTYATDGTMRLTDVVSSSTRSFTYDASGNVLSDGDRTFTYDGADRVTHISGYGTSSSMRYDAQGALYYQQDVLQESNQSVTYTKHMYDPTLGRFLQAAPSGYFFSKLWKGIKKFVGVIIVAVASYYCAGTCTTAMWSLIGASAGATSAAVNGEIYSLGPYSELLPQALELQLVKVWGRYLPMA
ncbi:hypothetical protein [Pseudidiomarina donghaiensis]|nr:hypothetical protein [Pseudidiomarina donghaiensis]